MDTRGEQHYRSIFELAGIGLADVDLQGNFRNANARYCQFLGFTREEICGVNFRDITHPEDLPRELELDQMLLDGRIQHYTVEKRYLRADRRVAWGQLSASLVRDREGRPEHFVTAVLDIDERKRAESLLRERDELLAKLTEHVPGVIFQYRCAVDGWESIPYASCGLQTLYGLDPGAVAEDARPMHSRVHPEDRPALRAAMLSSMRDLTPWITEYRMVAPDGELRWHASRARPERAADGATQWYGYVVDITEQKRYAEVLVAAEAAERANRAKTEFLSRMSHELRTPLNAVLGFAQLLRLGGRSLAAGQLAQVQHIERAGAHLLEMINDVLDLSRIEEGSLTLAPDSHCVAALVDETFALLQPAARDGGVRLVRGPGSDDALHVWADRLRLRQALANLVSNAIKYNRAGGEVRVLWRRDGDARLRLEILDTGPGLSAEQLAHLFEPFNRLGAERGGVEGTGIGLVITRRLLRLRGGDIEADSREGVGSRFAALLPLAPAAIVLGEPAPAAGLADAPANGAQRLVLYAEDNPMNVELVRQLLALRPAVRLQIARSGQEALRCARETPPDLLLLDMHLGDLSGLDVVRELADDPRLAHCPRIVLSADAMPERVNAARDAGITDYLTKPLDVAAFLACVDRHLAGDAALTRVEVPASGAA
jgi:PAS domain S-box-containing protein